MRFSPFVVFLALITLSGRSRGDSIRLVDMTLVSPTQGAAGARPGLSPPAPTMPAGQRVGAIVLETWLGATADLVLPLSFWAVYALLSTEGSNALAHYAVGSEINADVWIILLSSLASSGVIYGIAHAFDRSPPFLKMWGISMAVRLVVSGIFIAAGHASAVWALGTFAIAPLLGVTTELVLAQYDTPLPQPPPFRPAASSDPVVRPMIPILALSF